jgi:glycosyltransferase involved in cell wall biosynthesis
VGPRVAVVIPCHDDGRLALEAVDSIREAEPVEIVVVDDASEDPETLAAHEALRARGARVVRHERNRGLSASRMTGVRETAAPYVFDLDADDLAVPGSLALMADRLGAAPGAGVCFGDFAEVGARQRVRAVPLRLDPYRVAYTNEYPTSALFRRETLVETGGWEIPGGYGDWDLWMKLAERGEVGVHAGEGVITYRRRLHGERMLTATRRRHRAEYRLLRGHHPALFAQIAAHRRASPLSRGRKLLYPVVFGGRPRLRFESRVRAWMDALGVWRLQR